MPRTLLAVAAENQNDGFEGGSDDSDDDDYDALHGKKKPPLFTGFHKNNERHDTYYDQSVLVIYGFWTLANPKNEHWLLVVRTALLTTAS